MATEQQNAWVTRVLGLSIAVGPAAEDSAAEQAQDFTARLQIVSQDMREYGLLDQLAAPLRKAIEATKGRRADAGTLLDDLERQIAKASANRRMAEVKATVKSAAVSAKTGVVALGKARIQLAMARSTFQSVRQTLVEACEKTRASMVGDGLADDPDTIAAVAQIGGRVPDITAMSGDVENALDTMIGTADPALRDSARQKAIAAIGSYRRAVDGVPILTQMQKTPVGTFQIRDALVGALDTLEQVLAA